MHVYNLHGWIHTQISLECLPHGSMSLENSTNLLIYNVFFFIFMYLVPADVFSFNSGWTGFYEYLGKRQTATITVNAFNATTSRVNVTLLEQSGVQIKLSGEQKKAFMKTKQIEIIQTRSAWI